MLRHRGLIAAAPAAGALLAWACASTGGSSARSDDGDPLRHPPRPTSAAINEADLRTRLYIFADDSMMGRQYGRIGNMKGNDYIARELARLGVVPAGENGSYFQVLPSVQRRFTARSALTAGVTELSWETDWVAVPAAVVPRSFSGAQAIYGGVAGDTSRLITAEQADGKVVVLSAPTAAPAFGQGGGGFGGGVGARFPRAAAIATVNLDNQSLSARRMINDPPGTRPSFPPAPGAASPPAPVAGPAMLRVTRDAAAALLGAPVAGMALGTTGQMVTARLVVEERPVPMYARNVVGIIRGSDPALASEFVALGSHNDHIGFSANPVDHDSARAYATAALALQMSSGDLKPLTAEQRESIRVNVDSIRRIRPARLDSINNGADDDGSGSMAMLEIAEAIALSPVKPRRSILLVWHTGEETGLTGSRYYVQNPTVPREKIVAQINMDMIGRGRTGDIIGGGEDYLAVVGSRNLSTQLGQAVATINRAQPRPLRLEYRFDETTTWPGYNNIYGRSDHANYARCNIPIAFFFTGLHQDYHRVTDEAQYIDYPHYARITKYIHDLVLDIGNRAQRPVVDKPVAGC